MLLLIQQRFPNLTREMRQGHHVHFHVQLLHPATTEEPRVDFVQGDSGESGCRLQGSEWEEEQYSILKWFDSRPITYMSEARSFGFDVHCTMRYHNR